VRRLFFVGSRVLLEKPGRNRGIIPVEGIERVPHNQTVYYTSPSDEGVACAPYGDYCEEAKACHCMEQMVVRMATSTTRIFISVGSCPPDTE